MNPIPFECRLFDGPTRVVIEASSEVIAEQSLSTWHGEHYDSIDDVLVMKVEDGNIIFETCRTLEGWRQGRGRERWTFRKSAIKAVYVN